METTKRPAAPKKKQQNLTGIIGVMSVLIVIGLCLVVYGIVKKSGKSGDTAPTQTAQQQQPQYRTLPQQPPPPVANPMPSFENNASAPNGIKTITLPARSRILQISPYGSGVAMHVKTMQGEFIYFINTSQGKLEGALRLEYAPIQRIQPSSQPTPQKRR
jgi:hypothetical protein